MSATNSYEKQVLKNLLLGQQVNAITPYMGLSLSNPTENASNLSEPPGSANYGRVNLLDSDGFLSLSTGTNAWSEPDIDTSSGDNITNANQIVFPEATGSWGTITYWFIANSASGVGSDILAFGQLQSPRNVAPGVRLVFPPNSISLTAQ